jgi:hypothetical protein
MIAAAVLCVGGAGWSVYAVFRSPYVTREDVPRYQIVPFSHEHHVSGLGLDCRYCHTTVTDSPFAGMPSTHTCMTCHSQLFTREPILAPVRESFARNEPLRWTRVHDLPDFVFFDHHIHVAKGIGCVTCHGQVDRMPLVWQEHDLFMKWCLDCHRDPARFVRPREEVFNMNYQPPTEQLTYGRELVERYGIRTAHLTDCSICHR